jgi:hypothetical protein
MSRIEPSKIVVQLSEFMTRCLIRGGGAQSPPQARREGATPEIEQLNSPPPYGAKGVVDAIHARAGHDAQDLHKLCPFTIVGLSFMGECRLCRRFPKMSIKLYAGNLPFKSENDDLRNHFAQVGEVTDVHVLRNRNNGRAHGFGFIDMATDEDARKAIEAFNEKEFDGRKLSVCLARPHSTPPAQPA